MAAPRPRPQLRVQLGRVRTSARAMPLEAGYTAQVNSQMKTLRDNLLKVIEGIENATADALVYGMLPIYDESQRLVPKKTGKLMISGFLGADKVSGGARANIGYAAGGDPFYAALQHERLDFNHASPTQAKYLEAAVNQHINEIQPRVSEFLGISTGMRGGAKGGNN